MVLSAKQRADARWLYAKGWKLDAIARWMGCSVHDLIPWIRPVVSSMPRGA